MAARAVLVRLLQPCPAPLPAAGRAEQYLPAGTSTLVVKGAEMGSPFPPRLRHPSLEEVPTSEAVRWEYSALQVSRRQAMAPVEAVGLRRAPRPGLAAAEALESS